MLRSLRAHAAPAARAAATLLAQRSPLSVAVTLEAIRRAADMATLEQVLEQDRVLSAAFMGSPDFSEGVRAVLVDRDHQPRWAHPSLEAVSREEVDRAFRGTGPADARSPLPFLGRPGRNGVTGPTGVTGTGEVLAGVRSLAYRTDLALLTLGGSTIEHRDDHLVVRTPDNPLHWWGNFLLLPAARPRRDRALARRFAARSPTPPTWPSGWTAPRQGRPRWRRSSPPGPSAESATVMTATACTPRRGRTPSADCRPLASRRRLGAAGRGVGWRARTTVPP